MYDEKKLLQYPHINSYMYVMDSLARTLDEQ